MASVHPIIDSHVHLWPASAANQASHTWMTPNHPLAKPHDIAAYHRAASSAPVRGFVYVETDRALGDQGSNDVHEWGRGGLDEVVFLRRVVESDEGGDAALLGAVIWAPLDRPLDDARTYVQAVLEAAGETLWGKIKGFRFLLQGIRELEAFERLVQSENCVGTLRELGKRWSFDVGVDQRQGGVWQLELVAELLKSVRSGVQGDQKVIFVLNHLCKPDMRQEPATEAQKADFEQWKRCMERLASFDGMYLKLSGAFSEMDQQDLQKPMPVEDIVRGLKPWLDVVFRCFTPERIMFGSDWPVCNVGGPGDGSWWHWRNVVSAIMDDYNLTQYEKDRVWSGTAIEAYKLAL